MADTRVRYFPREALGALSTSVGALFSSVGLDPSKGWAAMEF